MVSLPDWNSNVFFDWQDAIKEADCEAPAARHAKEVYNQFIAGLEVQYVLVCALLHHQSWQRRYYRMAVCIARADKPIYRHFCSFHKCAESLYMYGPMLGMNNLTYARKASVIML